MGEVSVGEVYRVWWRFLLSIQGTINCNNKLFKTKISHTPSKIHTLRLKNRIYFFLLREKEVNIIKQDKKKRKKEKQNTRTNKINLLIKTKHSQRWTVIKSSRNKAKFNIKKRLNSSTDVIQNLSIFTALNYINNFFSI